ncbi:MAG TPA: hypothetical protein VFS08_12310 [Gemmatimonadaceae bacterium]|nr:hypothetical protein [Gemmatimonadaceae bacterium]
MPLVPFDTLPDSARVWVFASDPPLDDNAACRLLGEVDRFLAHWQAHGHPLDGARDWRYGRFLTIAVDQRTAGASGCSIDGLYRALRALQDALGTALLAGGVLYYRGAGGDVTAASRADFAARAARGEITRDTIVFDLTVGTLGEWRERFEAPASAGWHVRLLPDERTASRP